MYKPEGIAPAMLTAFDDDGKINAEVMGDIVDHCVASGCKMVFAVSSVGEFVHMETDETCQLMSIVKDAAKGRVPVIAGVTASHIDKSIELAKYAEQIGIDAIVCSPPYYYTVSQEIIESHYERLAEAVPNMPIIMYNIPLFSTPLSYDLVKRVSSIPNVVAIKDSSGSMVDLTHFMDKARLMGSDINVLAGREEIVFPATMIGGKGAMVGTANIFPEIIVRIYNATLAGDFDTARNLQFAICRAIRIMFSVSFPVGFKAAMEVRGFDMGPSKAALSDADKIRAAGLKIRLHDTLSELCDYADIPLLRGRGVEKSRY
jgi:4-hydroxy-tetrahydrodipicolinate synthase